MYNFIDRFTKLAFTVFLMHGVYVSQRSSRRLKFRITIDLFTKATEFLEKLFFKKMNCFENEMTNIQDFKFEDEMGILQGNDDAEVLCGSITNQCMGVHIIIIYSKFINYIQLKV